MKKIKIKNSYQQSAISPPHFAGRGRVNQNVGQIPLHPPLVKGDRGGFSKGDLSGGLKNPASCILHRVSFVIIILALLLLPSLLYAAQMEDYCIVPPYVKRDVSVNIMVLIDNSIDMLAPAYMDTTYCQGTPGDSTNCINPATGKYYKEYFGHFSTYGCYLADAPGAGGRFKYQGPVDYTTYEHTGCPINQRQFNGNILNWATMSRFSIAKKVLTGEASTQQTERFEIEGMETLWTSAFGGVNYRNSNNCRWMIDTSPANQHKVLELTVSDPSGRGVCRFISGNSAGPWGVKILTTEGVEDIRGILQEFTDVNPQNDEFDRGAPRFGITIFSQTGVTISEKIPPEGGPGAYTSFINTVKTMGTRANNDLATAHKTIDDYFISPSPSPSKDPYKGCGSWEGATCVQGVAVPCRKSAILMLTTGTDVTGTTYALLPAQCSAGETRPLVRNACYAYNTDLRTDADLPAKQNLETYVIQTFGTAAWGTTEATTLEQCASAPGNTKVLCEAAVSGGGTYYSAGTDDLADTIRKALQDIIKRAAAGTAASVLASGEGSGANLIQAVFYPRAMTIPKGGIFGSEIDWIGRLTNYWYYVDPFFAMSSIYEDNTSSKRLNLTNDNKIELYFDTSSERTKARRFKDTNSDGVPDTLITPDIEFEKLSSIWEAGLELWKRDLSTSPRTIKTTIGGGLIDFSEANRAALKSLLQAGSDNEAEAIIRYVRGEDNPTVGGTTYSYRTRTVAVDLNNDGDTLDTVDGVSEGAKVWKLGDILNSTPKIASWLPLNTYHKIYQDDTYGDPQKDPSLSDPADNSRFITSDGYRGRGMVFAGGNDGMLHAFKLGTLELKWAGQGSTEKARLTGTDLGKEVWAFIPKNALPYLKYLTDPGYCHIYTVDATPYVFDASINGNPDDDKTVNSWRTILIGGMRWGGACKPKNPNCSTDTPNSVCAPAEVGGSSIGYSSYFALDITDQNNPTLLWEFSDPTLGFTTTGPAVVRINASGDPNGLKKNGHWFVVFGSGPTGPTTGSSSTEYQFLGRSDQNLRLFVLDLKTGSLLETIDTGIQYAFAGSMLNSTIDPDLDYQDNAVYIPYVKKTGTTWTDGGVGRLITKESLDVKKDWKWSPVMDGIGPVTSAVARLQNNKTNTLWLFFGTGRYYFERTAEMDDPTAQRTLYGIKEPCFSEIKNNQDCSKTGSASSNATDNPNLDPATITDGWYINLDLCTTSAGVPVGCGESTAYYRAERVITDPSATTTGVVFFTTYRPYTDVCSLGGKSHLWAVKYSTGGYAGSLLKGKVLIQVSTGAIEQIDLVTAFKQTAEGKWGRRSSMIEGVPPTAQGMSILRGNDPNRRTIHMRER